MVINFDNIGGGGGGGSYTLPTATANRLGGIKVGSGLTVANDGTLSTSGGTYELPVASQSTLGGIKIGTGLAIDSGGTVSVSGGTGGGPTEYYLNNMSQQELAALYAAVSGATGMDNNSGDTLLSDYRFYIYGDVDGQKWSEAFFSNWEEQEGNYYLYITSIKPPKPSYGCGVQRVWAAIHPDGYTEFNSDGFDANSIQTGDIFINVNSGGTITNPGDCLSYFSSLSEFHRLWFKYVDENITNNFCAAPLQYFWRQQENDDLVEYIGGTININGTLYKGTWHFAEWGWGESVAPDTWTTV